MDTACVAAARIPDIKDATAADGDGSADSDEVAGSDEADTAVVCLSVGLTVDDAVFVLTGEHADAAAKHSVQSANNFAREFLGTNGVLQLHGSHVDR